MSDKLCSICLENTAKYTCPSCKAQTCSATCVKRHKLHSECSGLPDPTKFVPNKDLEANSALVNRDYNYLLTLERKISLAKKDVKDGARNVFKRNANQTRNNKFQRLNSQAPDEERDKRLDLVEKSFPHKPSFTIRRQNTLVVQLPSGMSRATQNKSGYDKKSGSYIWTIDWIPVDSEGNVFDYFTSFRLKEGQLLKEAIPISVLNRLFAPKELNIEEFSFYLENCLKSPNVARSLLPLDPETSIADNLKDMAILEYPRIFVIHSPSVWKEFVQTKTEVFKEKEAEHSSDSSSSDDTDLTSDSSSEDSSGSLDSDSDDEPEEESSKLENVEIVHTEPVADEPTSS